MSKCRQRAHSRPPEPASFAVEVTGDAEISIPVTASGAGENSSDASRTDGGIAVGSLSFTTLDAGQLILSAGWIVPSSPRASPNDRDRSLRHQRVRTDVQGQLEDWLLAKMLLIAVTTNVTNMVRVAACADVSISFETMIARPKNQNGMMTVSR